MAATNLESDYSYKAILNSIGEAIFIQYPDSGIIHDVNDSMLEMYGYKRHEIIGKTVEDISATEEGYTAKKASGLIKSVQNNNIEQFEWKAKRKNNTTFWAEVSLKLTKISEKNWLIAVVRDISDKKLGEIRIKQHIEFQKILADLSTTFISLPLNKFNEAINKALMQLGQNFQSDRAYIFSYNKKFTKMSNTHEWCNDGIISFKENLQNIPIEDFQWHHNQLFVGKSIQISDVSLLTIDATSEKKEFEKEGIQSLLIVPFLHERQIVGFIGVDFVNAKRQISDEDEVALKAFGNIIGQALVRKKYENQLKKSKKKAEESDRLKSAFLSNMSHEIRTPMNGILGFSELLAESDLNKEEQRTYFQIISESSRQLLSIINDIIDISKIESGQIYIYPVEFNIVTEFNSIISFFKPFFKKKNIVLESSIINNSKSEIITADSVKLNQILTNLINNALKYTIEGLVKVKMLLSKTQLTIEVIDSGIGMDKKTIDIIFDRFQRGENKQTHLAGGTGLGLAITKGYVDKMKGIIEVKSRNGKGSQFKVVIPLRG